MQTLHSSANEQGGTKSSRRLKQITETKSQRHPKSLFPFGLEHLFIRMVRKKYYWKMDEILAGIQKTYERGLKVIGGFKCSCGKLSMTLVFILKTIPNTQNKKLSPISLLPNSNRSHWLGIHMPGTFPSICYTLFLLIPMTIPQCYNPHFRDENTEEPKRLNNLSQISQLLGWEWNSLCLTLSYVFSLFWRFGASLPRCALQDPSKTFQVFSDALSY